MNSLLNPRDLPFLLPEQQQYLPSEVKRTFALPQDLPLPVYTPTKFKKGMYTHKVELRDSYHSEGYFSGFHRVPESYVWTSKAMGPLHTHASTNTYSLEQFYPHIYAARGRVAVFGLSMGEYLPALLSSPNVETVEIFYADVKICHAALRLVEDCISHLPEELAAKIVGTTNYDKFFPINEKFDYIFFTEHPFGHEEAMAHYNEIYELLMLKAPSSYLGMELDFLSYIYTQQFQERALLNPEMASGLWANFSNTVGMNIPRNFPEMYPLLALHAVTRVINKISGK